MKQQHTYFYCIGTKQSVLIKQDVLFFGCSHLGAPLYHSKERAAYFSIAHVRWVTLADVRHGGVDPLRAPTAVVGGDAGHHGGRGGATTHGGRGGTVALGLGGGVGVTLDQTRVVPLTLVRVVCLHHTFNDLPAQAQSKLNTQTKEPQYNKHIPYFQLNVDLDPKCVYHHYNRTSV